MKTFQTSNPRLSAIAGAFRTRIVRTFFAAVFVFAVLSPVAVVAAVVWTAPPISTGSAATTQDMLPARLLPAPDVQPTSLPDTAFNVYANTLSGVVPCPLCELPPRVYVPNSRSGNVDVIDPRTFTVIDRYRVGFIPHHIAPAWDMSALYVDNEGSSSLTVLDIHTGRPTGQISIPFPYNLYFTPDGSVFYVTNQGRMGVSVIDPITMREIQFIPTGRGAHGLQVSRDTKSLYVSNRLE